MLEILRRYDVCATFFMVGTNATVMPFYAEQVATEGDDDSGEDPTAMSRPDPPR